MNFKIDIKWNDSRVIFLAIVVLLGLYMLSKLFFPILINPSVSMVIIKQKGRVEMLDTPVSADFESRFFINTIAFPENQVLIHKDMGNFGYMADFFITFDTIMDVKREGNYIFSVASDDGFRLIIDNNTIGEITNDRPFTTNQFTHFLDKGVHRYNLKYFQGFGGLGCVAEYQRMDDRKKRFIGQNSGFIDFKRF